MCITQGSRGKYDTQAEYAIDRGSIPRRAARPRGRGPIRDRVHPHQIACHVESCEACLALRCTRALAVARADCDSVSTAEPAAIMGILSLFDPKRLVRLYGFGTEQ